MLEQNRILIVDDEPLVLRSCRRIFGERGYDVETAASGQEGLNHLRRSYYDCALIDLKMPDVYGMELVCEMREYRAETPVLIITGFADVESASEATRLGVSDYIRKPFTPEQIIHAVERALDRGAPVSSTIGFRRLADKIGELAPKAEAYDARSPAAVAEMVTDSIGVAKVGAPLMNTLILGTLAGAPMGLLLKGAGIGVAGLDSLSWTAFLIDNLIPVTLGNIVGGAIFVGSIYWLVFMRNKHNRGVFAEHGPNSKRTEPF